MQEYDQDKGPFSMKILPVDLDFLMSTPLLDSLSHEARTPLLNCMVPVTLRMGERLIRQGEQGDRFFLIQEGQCVIQVEKEGALHPISRLGPGDIVGEMAILTGESRNAHADAESDLKLWAVSRAAFDDLCEKYPELRKFLTRLITRRFATEGPTAERNIGKYAISEFIGKGGWSTVYRGIHQNLNMPVAIKMLKHDLAMDAHFLQKFRDEARIIARLNHENIVKVYDIEELYRTIFIVMEHLEGMPLHHMLQSMHRLPLPGALDILMQISSGLSYAHEEGIIHHDIKPANIFIQPDKRVKIVDFGLACAPGTADSGWSGTIQYMSPEQMEGDPVDERTDIYSLGITAYEMLTGKTPFEGDSILRVLESRMDQEIPDPKRITPDLPDELCSFLFRATRREPEKRYQNVQEVYQALRHIADKAGLLREGPPREKKKMMTLFLFYRDEQQLDLNRLVEDFSKDVKKMGAILRAADFKEI